MIRPSLGLWRGARSRLQRAAAASVVAVSVFACGLLLVLVLSPVQAVKAWRVSRLPQMDAASVEQVAPGETVIVTGRLADNPSQWEEGGLVAYEMEEWSVTVPTPSPGDDDTGEPHGSWVSRERVIPDLNLDLGGEEVHILSNPDARLSGARHETLIPGQGVAAQDFDEPLPGGTRRYRGLTNGDLVTVLGKKASTDGIIPEEIFGGDRISYEAYLRQTASGLLTMGLCLMGVAPLILVGGLLAALFGKR